MFILQTKNGEFIEESNQAWSDIGEDIAGVTLIHPVLNISIGLVGYDRYAFLCEGVVLQQGYNLPRIAEVLWGEMNGVYVCLRLLNNGTVTSTITKEAPIIADTIWKRG